MHTMTLEKGLATFINALSGKNRSAATIRAYQTDIQQFISFLHARHWFSLMGTFLPFAIITYAI